MLIYRNSREGSLLQPLKNLLWINTNNDMPIAGALWFLTCLFFVDIFFLLIFRAFQSEKIRLFVIVIFVIVGTMIPALISFRLPWALDVSFVGLGIYYLGYLTRKYKQLLKNALKKTGFLWIVVACVTFVLIFVNGAVNLRTGDYAIIPLFWINMLCSVIILIYVALRYDREVSKLFEDNMLNGPQKLIAKILETIKKYLCYVGENSIVFLCLNQLCILVAKRSWTFLGIEAPVIRLIFVLIATMVALTILAYIIVNTKLKYTVGK